MSWGLQVLVPDTGQGGAAGAAGQDAGRRQEPGLRQFGSSSRRTEGLHLRRVQGRGPVGVSLARPSGPRGNEGAEAQISRVTTLTLLETVVSLTRTEGVPKDRVVLWHRMLD